MDVVVVQQFLNFFIDFIDLCQWKDWPSNETTEDEIRNAFVKSCHIEKCMDKFRKNDTLNDFLATLDCPQDSTNAFLKTCLSYPSKYILKRIINSDTKIFIMDLAFKVFLQQFPDGLLENYLRDLMLEASSKEILLKNLAIEVPRDKIMKFKREIFLSQISIDSKESLQEMLDNCNQEFLDLLVVSLCATEPKFHNSVNIISDCVLDVLLSKSNRNKIFWKLLFNVQDKYLIDMCVVNSDLYTYICEALIDCGKLIKENMSAEYFYIDFTYSELSSIISMLFKNTFLKAQFENILNNHDGDMSFWQNFL